MNSYVLEYFIVGIIMSIVQNIPICNLNVAIFCIFFRNLIQKLFVKYKFNKTSLISF